MLTMRVKIYLNFQFQYIYIGFSLCAFQSAICDGVHKLATDSRWVYLKIVINLNTCRLDWPVWCWSYWLFNHSNKKLHWLLLTLLYCKMYILPSEYSFMGWYAKDENCKSWCLFVFVICLMYPWLRFELARFVFSFAHHILHSILSTR